MLAESLSGKKRVPKKVNCLWVLKKSLALWWCILYLTRDDYWIVYLAWEGEYFPLAFGEQEDYEKLSSEERKWLKLPHKFNVIWWTVFAPDIVEQLWLTWIIKRFKSLLLDSLIFFLWFYCTSVSSILYLRITFKQHSVIKYHCEAYHVMSV